MQFLVILHLKIGDWATSLTNKKENALPFPEGDTLLYLVHLSGGQIECKNRHRQMGFDGLNVQNVA